MINALVNLINYEPDIDKTYLYAKDLCKARYQFLIKKRWRYSNKAFKWF